MAEDPKNKDQTPEPDNPGTNPQDNPEPSGGKGGAAGNDNSALIEELKKEISGLKDLASKSVDPEIVKSLLEKVETLSSTIEFLKKQEEERKKKEEEEMFKQMSETERLKHMLEKKEEEIERVKQELEESLGKKAKELEEKLNAYEQERAKLAAAAAKARALEVATRLGAFNPEQVYAMVRDALVTGDDGEIYARVPDGSGGFKQVPIDEYMKEFLSRPENKNLLKTNAAVGDEPPPKEAGTATPKKETDSGFSKLSKAEQEKIATEAALRGMDVETYFNILQRKKEAAKRYRERHMKK